MNNFIQLFFILFILQTSNAQNKEETNGNRLLVQLSNEIINSESDTVKQIITKKFNSELLKVINQSKSYLLDFNQIEILSVLQPKDKRFKIFTWFTPYKNAKYQYFGLIQMCKKNGKKCMIFNLSTNNFSDNLLQHELSIDQWYGCMYYDLIPIKINKQIYYTLLGWDGNNSQTTKKIIDVLKFSPDKSPSFGANIFNQKEKRIIIEYNSKYPISLKYMKDIECIVYDHTQPLDEVSLNNFSLYAPNLSYNVLQKTKKGWLLEKSIYLNNKK